MKTRLTALLGSLFLSGCVSYDDGHHSRERYGYYRDRPAWYEPNYPYYRHNLHRDDAERARAAAWRDHERHEWREHHDRDWH